MRDYEIEEVVESLMRDTDFYDYDDYAAESFDKFVVNTAAVAVAAFDIVPAVAGNLLNVPVALLSAANVRALTRDAIKSRDPRQIRNVMKAIKFRADSLDRVTSFSRLYTATKVTNAGGIYHADEVMNAVNECMPKLEAALRQLEKDRKRKGSYDDLWDY